MALSPPTDSFHNPELGINAGCFISLSFCWRIVGGEDFSLPTSSLGAASPCLAARVLLEHIARSLSFSHCLAAYIEFGHSVALPCFPCFVGAHG